jgi:hypothetical protein
MASHSTVVRRILEALDAARQRNGVLALSDLGFAAFPDTEFLSSQGAALSVGRVTHNLEEEGLIARAAEGSRSRRYEITSAGRGALADMIKEAPVSAGSARKSPRP